jgi:hypothetical protein
LGTDGATTTISTTTLRQFSDTQKTVRVDNINGVCPACSGGIFTHRYDAFVVSPR